MSSTTVKGLIGAEDINFAEGGTGAAETFSRRTSTGGLVTLTEIDASHLKYRNYATSVEDMRPRDVPVWLYGTIGTQAAIVAAIAAIGSSERSLYLPAATWSITDNLTIPSNVHLKLDRGAIFAIATTKTLTINSPFLAPPHQIFSCAGSGAVAFGGGTVYEAYPEWWGAKADYVAATGVGTDSGAAINAALVAHNRVKLQPGNYYTTVTIQIPAEKWLIGAGSGDESVRNTRIYPALSGTGTWVTDAGSRKWAVAYNTTSGDGWVSTYPPLGGMRGITLYGSHNSGFTACWGVVFVGKFSMVDCDFYYMQGGFKNCVNYDDQHQISGVTIWGSRGANTEYDALFAYLGDGVVIDRLNISGGTPRGLKVAACWGGSLRSAIINTTANPAVELTTCRNFTVQNLHNEGGTITQYQGNVTWQNCQFAKSTTAATMSITGNYYDPAHAVIDNCGFTVNSLINYATARADINYEYATVQLRDTHRVFHNQNAVDSSVRTGILVSYAGSMVTAFNNFSHLLSRHCSLSNNGHIEPSILSKRLMYAGGAFTPSSWSDTSNIVTWTAATGTYFYSWASIIDPTRMIGVNSVQEVSHALTLAGDGFAFDYYANEEFSNRYTILRVYRGTVTNSYNFYVDIPFISGTVLYDNGTHIMGFPWIARGAAAKDDVNYVLNQVTWSGLFASVYSAAAPTYGTWSVGDRWWDNDPAGGTALGGVCAVAGTPGTWINMPFLSEENYGVSAAIATGATIAHGLSGTPTYVLVTPAETGPTDVTVSAVGAATFVVNFGGGGNKTFYWQARKN